MEQLRKKCPFNRRKCMGEECQLWDWIEGKNPHTGEPISMHDCSLKLGNIHASEANRMAHHTQADLEQLRNEIASQQKNFKIGIEETLRVVKEQNEAIAKALMIAADRALEDPRLPRTG